jgi:hypothetical protein
VLGDWLGRQLREPRSWRAETAGGRAIEFLQDTPDRANLALQTCCQLVDVTPAQFRLHNDLVITYIKLFRNLRKEALAEVGKLMTTRVVRRLVYDVVQRELPYGKQFQFFCWVFGQARAIARHFCGHMRDGVILLVKTIFISACSDKVFRSFLFFEKVLFRDGDFLRILDRDTQTDWNLFFQVMWMAIARDPKLLQKCIDLDAQAAQIAIREILSADLSLFLKP